MTCSYQTLARFDDSSRSPQIRSLDDIRSVQRDLLKKARIQSKTIKMYRNRPTLAEFIQSNDPEHEDTTDLQDCLETRLQYEYPTDDYPASQSRYPTPSPEGDQTPYSQSQPSTTDDWASAIPDNFWSTSTATPSWSTPTCSTRSSPSHFTHFEDIDIPSFLLDTPSTTPTPGASGRNSPHNKESRQGLAHNTGIKSMKTTPKHKKTPICDPAYIKANLNKFYETLASCGSDISRIGGAVTLYWSSIVLSFQCSDLRMADESIGVLLSLSSENLISPHTVTHLLQHGLIFSLRDLTYRVDNGYSKISQLLVNLMRSCPQAIPYMVEIMSKCSLLDEFNDSIDTATIDDARSVIQFYSQISQTLISIMMESNTQEFKPIIPEILIATGVESHTLMSYSPEVTLRKLIKPKLIHNTIGKCLERSQLKDEDLVSRSLLLLADALKMAYFSQATDSDWVIDTLCAFRDSKLDNQLASLITALHRLIKTSESSEHSSQGHMVEIVANRILEQLSQFSSFYHDCYTQLSGFYERQLSARPVDPSASKTTSCLLDL